MNLSIPGFYQASTSPAARMTALVGDGRPYFVGATAVQRPTDRDQSFRQHSRPQVGQSDVREPAAASGRLDRRRAGQPQRPAVGLPVVQRSGAQHRGSGFGRRRPDRHLGVVDDDHPRSDGPAPSESQGDGCRPGQKDLFVEIGYMFTEDDPSPEIGPPSLRRRAEAGALAPADARGTQAHRRYIRERTDRQDKRALRRRRERTRRATADPYIIRGPAWSEAARRSTNWRRFAPAARPIRQTFVSSRAYPGTVGWKTGFQFIRDAVLSGPAPVPGAGRRPV